ncbi:MAG: CehA/McbA family metallohydrolase [Phycisphaeraceae bacterium]
MRFLLIHFVTLIVALCGPFVHSGLTAAIAATPVEILDATPLADADAAKAELTLQIVEKGDAGSFDILPARIIVTASDGSHPDGSGRDVYQDGRFFADGQFTVRLAGGKTKLLVQCGPEYEAVEAELDLPAGKATRARVVMRRWFDAASRGWYCGDNHVHTQHDARATVRTDASYTALQARANGLNFITEADHELSPDTVRKFDTKTFLYRQAPELRPGPFVGHFNTPGISGPIPTDDYQKLIAQPLLTGALREEVHRRDGVMIRTHPLTPPYQLHWMGAAATWSDAALGNAGDLLDVDSPAAELLWFTALNLDNRIGVSSYTDCALGRKQTMSPGDRRIYCQAEKFTYPAIVEAMKQGRTMATNGGPVFAFLTVEGRSVGDTLMVTPGQKVKLRCEIHSLRPLQTVELYHRGGRLHAFNVKGRSGKTVVEHEVIAEAQPDWFVLRADDEKWSWSITSPVYVKTEAKRANEQPATALLMEISNHTRFIQLRRQFFAHMIVTVRPPESVTAVRLLRDGKVEKAWSPDEPEERQDSRLPVTDIRGDYGPGWLWHRIEKKPVHFQADWPVKEAGWYTLEVDTSNRRTLRSDAMRCDTDNPNSHAISFAQLTGRDTALTLHGYGEEQALRDIRNPFVGDGWWYPRNTAWELKARLGEWEKAVGGNQKRLEVLFRREEARRER